MKSIEKILEDNNAFVINRDFERFMTSKIPNQKLAILSCMDTRLSEMLLPLLGLKNGDAKIIKNAGALVSHPYGSVMRSILLCIYEFDVTDILVIGHSNCGMEKLNANSVLSKMINRGISSERIEEIKSEIDVESWLSGFDSIYESVQNTVSSIKNHPLVPKDISVYGLIADIETGKLTLIK
ncbi:MAG: carbonic anhydrase [Bacillota bacterium]|nr:carbonic anhydrase [Bacillota bacterium]